MSLQLSMFLKSYVNFYTVSISIIGDLFLVKNGKGTRELLLGALAHWVEDTGNIGP